MPAQAVWQYRFTSLPLRALLGLHNTSLPARNYRFRIESVETFFASLIADSNSTNAVSLSSARTRNH